MALCKCWKCEKWYDYKQSLTRHTKHKHSEEDSAHDADTGDDNNHDSKDILKENNTNLFKIYDIFGHFSSHKCGQLFGNQESLECHIMLK